MKKSKAPANAAQHKAGYEVLGPIMAEYVARLDQTIRSFQRQHGAKVLYATRAGVRIQKLHQAYERATKREPTAGELFWISRFMAVKGLWKRIPESGGQILGREFGGGTCLDVVNALLRVDGGLPKALADDPVLRRPSSFFGELMRGGGPTALHVGQHLLEQSEIFEGYIASLIGKAKSALIVDSGWQGTTQVLLNQAFPDVDWWGAYFGRSFLPGSDKALAHKMFGLMFEADGFDLRQSMSAVVLHRHLIEDLFEPRASSVEKLVKTKHGVRPAEAESLKADEDYMERSPLFAGALEYVQELPDGSSLAEISKAYQAAAPRLARLIAYPTREEALTFGSVTRSADFGRSIKVPVLIDPSADKTHSAEERVRHALWQHGQVALEYPPDVAKHRQRQILGISVPADRLEKAVQPQLTAALPKVSLIPAVAIIMRTMDRPVFLERALLSVAHQTCDDYQLAIVCDGGPIENVLATVNRSPIDKRKVLVIDNIVNRGMEAASNIGIGATKSDFLIIHDDDDTWAPEFLEQTTDFLRDPVGEKYGGVITRSWYVSEEVTPAGISIRDKRGYQDWVDNVHFVELCCNNFFPPIAFLFRRSICEAVGGFDERFPVLGDWDFNLRFVLKADIGVIKEKLAFYHHRDSGQQMYANSVIGDIGKHAEYSAIMRNKYLRASELMQERSVGKDFVAIAHVIADLRNTIRAMDRRLGSDPQRQPEMFAQLKPLTDAADERWVAMCYLNGAGYRPIDEIAWRADYQWVQLCAQAASGVPAEKPSPVAKKQDDKIFT